MRSSHQAGRRPGPAAGRAVAACAALVLAVLVLAACASGGAGKTPSAVSRAPTDTAAGAYGAPTAAGRRTSSKVTQEEIERAGDMNIASFIESHLTGVRVTRFQSDYLVFLAGASQKNEGALVLIDGTEGPLAAMSLRDIASIEVLKDGAASVYGVRGGRGVLLITTRKR